VARRGQFVAKSLRSFSCVFFAIDFLRNDVLLSRGFDRVMDFCNSTTFQQNPSFMAFTASSGDIDGLDTLSEHPTMDK
jgi:hypothetical protein